MLRSEVIYITAHSSALSPPTWSTVCYCRYSSHQTISKSSSLSEPPPVKPAAGHHQVKRSRYRKLDYLSLAGDTDVANHTLPVPDMALGFQNKHILIGQVEEYNKRISLPTFHIKGNFTSDVSVEKLFLHCSFTVKSGLTIVIKCSIPQSLHIILTTPYLILRTKRSATQCGRFWNATAFVFS